MPNESYKLSRRAVEESEQVARIVLGGYRNALPERGRRRRGASGGSSATPASSLDSCARFEGGSQSYTTGVSAKYTNWGAAYDTDGYIVGGSTSQFVVPATGKYLIGASLRFLFHATGERALSLEVDGIFVEVDARTANVVTGTGTTLHVSTMIEIASGDVVSVTAYQDSGSSLTAGNGSFWIARYS